VPVDLLTVDQHGEAFVEREPADIGLRQLLFECTGHALGRTRTSDQAVNSQLL
jgi:hypothetical protein